MRSSLHCAVTLAAASLLSSALLTAQVGTVIGTFPTPAGVIPAGLGADTNGNLMLTGTGANKVVAFLDSLGRREFDSNGDNVLDQVDLAAFRLARNGGPYTADSPAAVFDFDQDGDVDTDDLNVFRTVYEADCNNNGINDLEDVLSGAFADSNGNLIPDVCEFCQPDLGMAGGGTLALSVCGDSLTGPASLATLEVIGAAPSMPVLLIGAFTSAPYQIVPGEFLVPEEAAVLFVIIDSADVTGRLRAPLFASGTMPTYTFVVQAAAFPAGNLDLSNALSLTVTL